MVVVDGHVAVKQVGRQRRPAVQAVVNGAGDGTAVGHALALQTQPQMEFLAKRPGPGLPRGQALLLRQFPHFLLDSVQPGDALHGLDPWAYLKDVLTRLPGHLNSRIDELLPHRWQSAG